MAAVTAAATGTTWAWQIEHNGPWRWEIGDGLRDGYVALSGPTLADHGWSTVLRPGQSVESVPATVTVAGTLEDAVARLTGFRRAARVAHPDDRAPRLVYNDYMNTLDGDPTTERLLPLVDAAARVGAEVFCIDAGWYDDSGDWWDSVGAWTPSSTRFPGGLGEVIGAIRDRGMIAGLWIEPEVVGVHSPVADELPAEAFLQLHGQRVVEHGRFHLDLRHPAARAHVDGVLDRLVDELGAGYVKMDYNIDPGVGTDRDADSAGEGLLGHCRAVQDVLDGLRARHPAFILESCSSGAMRADVAITSRTQLQSTSDQQDPLAYPPIAASAPMSILPEQAANWAYPHPDMTLEQVAFTLTTGLAGRLYLSGFLPCLGPDQLALVLEAVALYRERREDLPRCVPFWPLGLPGWDDDTVALGLRGPGSSTLLVWDRRADGRPIEVPLPAGTAPRLDQVFPRALPAWDASVGEDGIARLRNPTGEPSARIFRLLPAR
ncbi:alpha-galactosidase [Brachybacterium huguangmaarense]|uniref:Alpha-galactosidase n=1 Tax=Brachybacterium huguangmaarense TaxID=1652028 RepID=A0ABY6G2Z6_9MICO|nr:glycoside hydrolase family 36 protein [Brachybacterium huguangmaarense]UYG17573.1 alpha-galactosidase [Brachybacterium huguangmaarense]